jgi:hypothetical protein
MRIANVSIYSTEATRDKEMKKVLAIALLVSSHSAFAMFGNPISEKVPNWLCSADITFNNGESRSYQLNTKNIMKTAQRVDHEWEMVGKADSTQGKLVMKVYDLNMRGEIIYYTPDGNKFGNGKVKCN